MQLPVLVRPAKIVHMEAQQQAKVCNKCKNQRPLTDYRRIGRDSEKLRGICRFCRAKTPGEQRDSKARSERQAAGLAARNEKYLAEHGSFPLCECGCGQEVQMVSWTIPRFLRGHIYKDRKPFLDESNSVVSTELSEQLKKLRVERGWTIDEMAEHAGLTRGQMMNYLRPGEGRHRQEPVEEMLGNLKVAPGNVVIVKKKKPSVWIPAENVRQTLFKLKQSKGMTTQDMADLAGISLRTMQNYFRTEVKNFRREGVEDMFRRFAGVPMPPTEYQLKLINEGYDWVYLPGGARELRTPGMNPKSVRAIR